MKATFNYSQDFVSITELAEYLNLELRYLVNVINLHKFQIVAQDYISTNSAIAVLGALKLQQG
jgi:hypothetical protein